MDLSTAMAELESMGTEQNRKIYRRHGVGDRQFGVSSANLKSLKKQIKTDQSLAEALWQTGNADARNHAAMIADPKAMSLADLGRWLDDLANYYSVNMFTQHLVSKSPLLRECVELWSKSFREFVSQAGWDCLAYLALQANEVPDKYFEEYLEIIEDGVHSRPNRTRYSMNGALIAIGCRNAALRAKAEEVARHIGPVDVDHGETGCATPEPVTYIKKTWARRK